MVDNKHRSSEERLADTKAISKASFPESNFKDRSLFSSRLDRYCSTEETSV